MEERVLEKLPSLCHTPKDSGTPAPQQTSSGKQPMSAALRERLRKTRRSFNTNITVAKRLKIETEEKDCADADKECLPKTSTDCSRLQGCSKNLERNSIGRACFKSPLQESGLWGSAENSDVLRVDLSWQQSLEEKVRLVKQVQEKEELLRRLKMVKMYRSKNNLSELQALITKWRSSTQLMLYELQSAFSADGKKLHKKNVKNRQKRIKELEKCISLKEQENYELSLELKEMLVSVSERRSIFEAADTQDISEKIAKQRYQEILKQKHLQGLVKDQEEQFEILQAEVERLRSRTFPIL